MRRPLLLALAFAAVLLAGCAGAPAAPSSGGPATASQIDIRDSAFHPNPVTVKAGVPIHFTNHDASMHAVAIHSPQGAQVFDRHLGPGESADFTFPDAGQYHLFCNMHMAMASDQVTAV